MRDASVRTAGRLWLFLCLVLIAMVFPSKLQAQQVSAAARADTSAIRIGDQFRLELTMTHPSGIRIEWPSIADTFSLMEVVKRSPVYTVADPKNKNVILKQHLIITSFDSGYHVIPPFVFNYRLSVDTSLLKAETEPILIAVNSVPVDTTRAIKDIKDQERIPFTWQDALPYLFGVILLGLVAWLVYFLYRKYRRKDTEVTITVPLRPAHEIALEALKELDEAKLWQQGNFKGYYTGLSDIIRTFIDNRWGVNAMEMITDEILGLQVIRDNETREGQGLSYLLRMADLVKFAKATPIHHENEQCMSIAVSFVSRNALAEKAEEAKA
jgi:hypothetical protein